MMVVAQHITRGMPHGLEWQNLGGGGCQNSWRCKMLEGGCQNSWIGKMLVGCLPVGGVVLKCLECQNVDGFAKITVVEGGCQNV